MINAKRRTFLKVLGGAAAATAATSPMLRALADNVPAASDDFFIFIAAGGGWDITLWADPRDAESDDIEPSTSDVVDTAGITHWPTGADGPVTYRPSGSNITFGPAIGDLADHYDRLLVINGIQMATVAHNDGQAFSATGRHLTGGRVSQPSIDTVLGSSHGTDQLLPVVSLGYPSYFIGSNLDSRAMPLRVGSVGGIATSLQRTGAYDTSANRDAVTNLLVQEARDLEDQSYYPTAYRAMRQQFERLPAMLSPQLTQVFNRTALLAQYPGLASASTRVLSSNIPVNVAFAIETIRKRMVRSVSMSVGGFDGHLQQIYRPHAMLQQELFNVVAQLLAALDATSFADQPGVRLSERTHILINSDFGRTPKINGNGGRDHWPCGSNLIISPRFVGNRVIGASDSQLLPRATPEVFGGMRPLDPADILVTYMTAFGVPDPHSFMRDGEVIPGIIRS